MDPVEVTVDETGDVGDLINAFKNVCGIDTNTEAQIHIALNDSLEWLSSPVVELLMEGKDDSMDLSPFTALHPNQTLWNLFNDTELPKSLVGEKYIHVIVTITADTPSSKMTRRPRLPPNVEQELELWCLVVGGGEDPFPVIIKTTDRVQELKNTIGDQWLTSTQISGGGKLTCNDFLFPREEGSGCLFRTLR
ncbi:hypothetical protein GN244_ATG02286 [Phytophthora infestans]|uniref:Crinkler effector protein N-terminal domain-containing protein n=1 Tax=Phytophthora infestans TaxID=4787 RepID=A0A833SSU3_PHYIN|nr:hypothetical protein GN244_ATG02286 [Phytophthora infestans]KAF4132057.1 hypothetical protein GN958_ATG18727 [Phytophthora infestans]KAF4148090.1 hypothetical protein GN958_ATG02716 [Phytophthora infestans]KAF4148196.1 hypothetical protein GN958_ATG02620 [Phytophthora infestans]